MTIQGAIYELNNMLSSNDIPCYWKPAIKKIIETVEQNVREMSEQTDGDLISRDYVLSKFKEQCDRCGKYKENNGVMCRCCALDDAIDYVEDAPSVEKTAEWIDLGNVIQCSNCETLYPKVRVDLKHYCERCGSRMKGVEQ